MAFDIYAGTFQRFYTQNWENVVQKQARQDGVEYRKIYAGGAEEPATAEEVRSAVDAWRQGMNNSLAPHGVGPMEWSEADEQPYFTDRPSWEGYLALQLWAAHLERPDLPVPYALPGLEDDSALTEVFEDAGKLHFRSILEGSVWLPGDFNFQFMFPALTEGEVMISSTGRLLRELEELRTRPLQWNTTPSPATASDDEVISFQEIAEWSLPIFHRVVEQGNAARVPFMLSF